MRATFGNCYRVQNEDWVWYSSDVVVDEIEQTPDSKRRERVMQLIAHASDVYQLSETDIVRASVLTNLGFSSMDALHIACAERCGADVFLTTDDRLFRRAARLAEQLQVVVENPLHWLVRQQESES
jgi:predicted nucleic acid-binding protein